MLDKTLRRLVCAIGLCAASAASLSETVVSGQVRDINGNPLKQVLVTLSQPPGVDGAGFTTVFTDAAGRFAFGKRIKDPLRADVTVEAKALGYRMVFPQHGPAKLPPATSGTEMVELVLVLQPQRNQADTAPASAWRSIRRTQPSACFASPGSRSATNAYSAGTRPWPARRLVRHALGNMEYRSIGAVRCPAGGT